MSRKKSRKKRNLPKQRGSVQRQSKKVVPQDESIPAPENLQVASSDPAHEIFRLISNGKAKAALSKAKSYHKRLDTPESEKVLVDAYLHCSNL